VSDWNLKIKETKKMEPIKGIDISHWQGAVDFKKVAASGVKFVMVKATQGTAFIDERFASNVQNAHNCGLLVGVYHYFTAPNVDMACREAAHCLSVIAPYRQCITLWAACDVEETKVFGGLSKQQVTAAVRAFNAAIQAGGYCPMVYTNRSYMSTYVDIAQLDGCDIWQAHWSASKPGDAGDRLKIWQYSGTGSCAGISGAVDLNYGYFEIDDGSSEGDEKELTRAEIKKIVEEKLSELMAATDKSKLPCSDWAIPATQWAIDNKIFSGDGNGNYSWQVPITREEVAQVLYNMREK
jgi:lysozyme